MNNVDDQVLTVAMAKLSSGLRITVPETDRWRVYEEMGNVYVVFARDLPDGNSPQWSMWISGYMMRDAVLDIEGYGRHLGSEWVRQADGQPQ